MIVADTTNANTGKFGGVVVKLQKDFEKRECDIPTFFGCQHHILDRVLKHCFDHLYGSETRDPEME